MDLAEGLAPPRLAEFVKRRQALGDPDAEQLAVAEASYIVRDLLLGMHISSVPEDDARLGMSWFLFIPFM
jgi:hypothetical protein